MGAEERMEGALSLEMSAVGQSVACVARFYVAGRATVAGTIFGAGQLELKNPRPFPYTRQRRRAATGTSETSPERWRQMGQY